MRARLGATVMPVSFRYKRDEVEYQVDDAKAKVVVAEPANRDEFAGLDDVIFRGEAYDEWVAAEDAAPLADQVGDGFRRPSLLHVGHDGSPQGSGPVGTIRSGPRS